MKCAAMKYPCGTCGRHLPAEKMVFSRFTGNRYCGIDLDRCEAKAKARKRKERAAA